MIFFVIIKVVIFILIFCDVTLCNFCGVCICVVFVYCVPLKMAKKRGQKSKELRGHVSTIAQLCKDEIALVAVRDHDLNFDFAASKVTASVFRFSARGSASCAKQNDNKMANMHSLYSRVQMQSGV